MSKGKRIPPQLDNLRPPELQSEAIATAVVANTNIFTDLEAPDDGFWIIQLMTNTAGYPKVVLTPAGTTTSIISGLNESSNLTVDSLYEFWLTARKGDKLNLQFSASATVTIRVYFVRRT